MSLFTPCEYCSSTSGFICGDCYWQSNYEYDKKIAEKYERFENAVRENERQNLIEMVDTNDRIQVLYDGKEMNLAELFENRESLTADIKAHEEKIRADERAKFTYEMVKNSVDEGMKKGVREFAEWLEQYTVGDELCIYPYDKDSVVNTYEKEKNNGI
mgnify:CR=1 FL=1